MTDKKQLEKNSKYAQFDVDGDGVVTDEEMAQAEAMIALENQDKKEDQLRQMAWVAMLSMVFFTAALYVPLVSIDRLAAIDNILQMFYIAQAGVVATFFGANAYMSK
jgi:hypothetical protein